MYRQKSHKYSGAAWCNKIRKFRETIVSCWVELSKQKCQFYSEAALKNADSFSSLLWEVFLHVHVDIYSVCEEWEHCQLCMRIKGISCVLLYMCACMITVSDWIRSSTMLVSYMIFEVIWVCLSLTEPLKIMTMTFCLV